MSMASSNKVLHSNCVTHIRRSYRGTFGRKSESQAQTTFDNYIVHIYFVIKRRLCRLLLASTAAARWNLQNAELSAPICHISLTDFVFVQIRIKRRQHCAIRWLFTVHASTHRHTLTRTLSHTQMLRRKRMYFCYCRAWWMGPDVDRFQIVPVIGTHKSETLHRHDRRMSGESEDCRVLAAICMRVR